MTKIKLTQQWVDPTLGRIGKPALSEDIGRRLQNNISHLLNYRFNSLIASFSHPPTANNPSSGTFRLIVNGPEPADNTYRYLAFATMWITDQAASGGTKISYRFPSDVDTGSAGDWQVLHDPGTTFNNSSYTDCSYKNNYDCNIYILDEDDLQLSWEPDGTNYWRVVDFKVYDLKILSLAMFEIPKITGLTDAQEQISADQFSVDSIIKGYTTTNQSLGGLVNLIGTGYHHFETVERMTRKCLFQWSHPEGVRVSATSFTDNFNGFLWRVKPRQTISSGTLDCYPCFIINASDNSGVEIKVTNTTNSATWTWDSHDTSGLQVVGAELGTSSTSGYVGIACNVGSYNDLKIETKCGSSDTVDLLTCSLWEGRKDSDGKCWN